MSSADGNKWKGITVHQQIKMGVTWPHMITKIPHQPTEQASSCMIAMIPVSRSLEESSSYATLQIMSDLHLESPKSLPMYHDFQIKAQSPYLALLGDIGNVHDCSLFEFLDTQLNQFKIVFYVLGNHEPYCKDDVSSNEFCSHKAAVEKLEAFEKMVEKKREECRDNKLVLSVGRFIFLNRRRFDLSDAITILGATLFSNISASHKQNISLFISDFSNISGWNIDCHNAAHRADLEWLNREVELISATEPGRTIVILTHYSPTILPEANDPEHLEDPHGVLSAFVTNLENEACWTKPDVTVWAFGHTHYNCDFTDKQTGKRVVANQRGYEREDIFDFDENKIIKIGSFGESL